ncbi:MAG: MarR family transcriptional regulator [Actinobacteria bacterium]|nr:MarR family transcriptional regulator [Actinomycetota bacterium]
MQVSQDDARDRRRRPTAVRQALRELATQLSLLNQQVSGRLELRASDIQCLDLIGSYGPLSPTALARLAGLHPATLTGILDRLERGGWIARDRDPGDRRGVLIRALPDRSRDILGLYAGMNASVTRICADYTDDQLALIAGFLRRVAAAGRDAVGELGRRDPGGRG